MDMREMKLGDFLKLVEMFKGDGNPSEHRDLGLQIVVLDRGFVYVGRVTIYDGQVEIRDAQNIRRWGTMKGLGELTDGPTKNTILDKAGTVRCSEKGVMHFIACEEKAWKTAGF